MTGNGGASSGHGVRQSLTMTSRSIGAVFRSTNARRPTRRSVPPPPYNSTCVPENAFLTLCTAASQQATTTSAPYPSWRVKPASSATARASCESSIEPEVSIRKPGRRPRLIEARHDELAVARLPAMRPAVGAVVSAERAVAQGAPHGVADRRHVVDFRRERRPRPAAPRRRHVAVVRGLVVDPPRHVAPHELGLDPVDARTPPSRHRRPAAPRIAARRARPSRSPAARLLVVVAGPRLRPFAADRRAAERSRARRCSRSASHTCRAAADRRAAAVLPREGRR